MKSLLVLLALTLTTSAFARDNNRDGRMGTNDGGTIIRIEVGNDRDTDSRATMKRMIQLERAVRELQNRVYDLEDDARPQTREIKVYTCETTSDFGEGFLGAPALTELEARSNAKKACMQRRSSMFCENVARCETRTEIQKI
ncbi:hypothetical protein SHI21_01265 [Bacteriovorax sp. PP10]|uniref:Secreted protein n=1 Tax=Bacteriovorax antarcticus TaxID=3088717 RepID=A0ABU5VP83_9BACT|nr:hypothetical protein [Bacteriovorax sp. PP10]MEA9354811.1 hypothetical protein [Bacteriovorax sp. PP10]